MLHPYLRNALWDLLTHLPCVVMVNAPSTQLNVMAVINIFLLRGMGYFIGPSTLVAQGPIKSASLVSLFILIDGFSQNYCADLVKERK